MTLREWNTAVGTGLLRIVVGVCLLRWRRLFTVQLAGAAPDDRLVRLLFGYFGVRDVTVGVATLAATRPGADVVRAVTTQGLADTTDAVVLAGVTARGHLPRGRGLATVGLAAGTALIEFGTAWDLRRRRR